MRLKADLTLFIISIIWGSGFVAQRIAGQLGSVYLFNGARYLLAGLVVFPFIRKADKRSISREQYKWMALAGFLLFLAAAFQQVGIQYTSAGNAGFITSLYVVLVPILMVIWWKDRPHWLIILSVVIAGLGAFLLSTGGKFIFQVGDALELAGALFWAVHVVVLGKFAVQYEPLSFSSGQLIICGLLNLILGAFIEEPIFTWPLAGGVIYTAVMSLGLCYTLQVWAQRHTPPSDAALILSLESVFAVLFGWLLLGENLSGVQIIGCFLIFGAVVMSQFREWTSGKIDPQHLIEGR